MVWFFGFGSDWVLGQPDTFTALSCADMKFFFFGKVQCGDADLEKKIEEKIDQFIGWIEKHPNKKSQVHTLP